MSEAGDGKEGLEALLTSSPDCVLLDLLMPQMSGLEVLEALQKQECKTPVIVLTADIQESIHQQCSNLGAYALINKPPKKAALLATVMEAVGVNDDKGESA